jgi:hypothetical protein
MCTESIVIGGVILQYAAQLRFVEHDQVIESFTPNRSDEALDVTLLPWRPSDLRLRKVDIETLSDASCTLGRNLDGRAGAL